ncbi:MAG: hypothetical protein OHK0023_18190 [Anaerolineae bacterium]
MLSERQEFILVAVDTAGIQSYIFGSNRLKENIGASYLVKQATENWAIEALRLAAPNANAASGDRVDKKIEIDGLDAEVLYAGGGNFVALFRHAESAKAFTRTLSKRVLINAPGLRLDIHQEPLVWTGTGLGEAVGRLLQNMKKERGKKTASGPLMGLGVTVMCQSTALPAVEVIADPDRDERYVSAEVWAKHKAADRANDWLRRELPPGDGYDYPLDLDDLGRSTGERSYIAVVHADGNGMGQIIRAIGEERDNRAYISKMRQFSEQVKVISTTSMMAVIKLLKYKTLEGISILGTRTVSDLEFPLDKNDNLRLPIRPIVFGGDDTTFVCDGRIGLSLAVEYLHTFETEARKQGLKLSACAGIAIVKSHYPFARAYQLSEELCDEAKKFRRKNFKDGGGALDWHFTSGGLYDELEAMRKREYDVSVGSLTLRPVSLGREGGVRSWAEIERLTIAFQQDWADKRNKAKALRDALRDGSNSVARFLSIYEQKLPELTDFDQTGWNNDLCGYFDALELMDIHIPLREKEAQP